MNKPITPQEAIKAAQTLKGYCEEHWCCIGVCDNCPFDAQGGEVCRLFDGGIPKDWILAEAVTDSPARVKVTRRREPHD